MAVFPDADEIWKDAKAALEGYGGIKGIALIVRHIEREDVSAVESTLVEKLKDEYKVDVSLPSGIIDYQDVRLEVLLGNGSACRSFKPYAPAPPEGEGHRKKRKAPNDEIRVSGCFVHARRAPVIIAGFYCKHQRFISHTPMVMGGKELYAQSVSGLLSGPAEAALNAKGHNFHSGGREDADVLMLNDGRPFVLVLEECATRPSAEALLTLQSAINEEAQGVVSVRGLRDEGIVPPDAIYKDLELKGVEKRKTYGALIYHPLGFPSAFLSFLKDQREGTEISGDGVLSVPNEIVLTQRTPSRVSHRRAILDRERSICDFKMKVVEKDPRYASIQLTAQSGTYIKEFVHSDFGRTKPSLTHYFNEYQRQNNKGGEAPVEVSILQLDVLAVEM